MLLKRFLLIILVGSILAGCGQRKLNLLILHTDQQSQWTVGVYGLDDLRGPLTTPNLDALAEDGILFTNFFTNSGVCSPSRALMMTGCYAPRNGVYANDMIMSDIPTLATQLNDAGYTTGYAGKWHLSGMGHPGWEPDGYGWTDNRFMFNSGHYKKITEQEGENPKAHPYKVIGDKKSYTTDWLTNKTLEFIRTNRNTKFAYMVSYPDPHQPWEVREPFNSMFDPADMSIPDSYSQRIDPLTGWHADIVKSHKKLSQSKLQRIKSKYSGSVKLLDYNMGRIIDELKELDLYDKTLIVFTTDHGEYMGEHGMLYKNHFFETAYRLPMIVRIPDGDKEVVNSHIFSMVDFMPGILNLLGIEPNEEVQGRDFSRLLTDENVEWKEEAQIHHALHKGAGLFTPDYYLLLHRTGEHLLFDRKNDPKELYNLYNDPDLQLVIIEMTNRILEHHKLYNTPEWEWLGEL
ncbi:MAG: sulfatase-like hydrolase/transferase [Bacteroidales bacterium]|nr:sulfatase-like hydrolase/transferase [Bacteroidales bacterium]